jgi:hypothetical protein
MAISKLPPSSRNGGRTEGSRKIAVSRKVNVFSHTLHVECNTDAVGSTHPTFHIPNRKRATRGQEVLSMWMMGDV